MFTITRRRFNPIQHDWNWTTFKRNAGSVNNALDQQKTNMKPLPLADVCCEQGKATSICLWHCSLDSCKQSRWLRAGRPHNSRKRQRFAYLTGTSGSFHGNEKLRLYLAHSSSLGAVQLRSTNTPYWCSAYVHFWTFLAKWKENVLNARDNLPNQNPFLEFR